MHCESLEGKPFLQFGKPHKQDRGPSSLFAFPVAQERSRLHVVQYPQRRGADCHVGVGGRVKTLAHKRYHARTAT